ncbi:hypothetical protein BDQ94DRAFT_164163 [Aspergillus welwitschiae]|uniref:Uncharacterized protein n=1 Tax=Aspergillus welwitschiae TaxID=1341132 RepID=A0A3F3PJ93_9EURO|nr:hypothetical protein BDQ94DRAFT_164163 [Aspergillus welwitschiae]RDH26812.1 hypothetical protein BDQ94DRAFT_164163 [Aspergillus welwitschiae]
MTGCMYVRSFNDQFRLLTGNIWKQPVFLFATARGNVKCCTVFFSTTDEADETKIKEKKKIKKEIIEKEESVDDFEILDAEIEALDTPLKHQLSQSSSPPHRTRKRYVIREDDKNRAAEYGPSGL